MIQFDIDKNCYGCGACAFTCPVKAISLVTNSKGFMIPQINESKCINCTKCDSVCPYLNIKNAENKLEDAIFKAGFRINIDNRKKSSSGGIAAVLTENFLKKQHVVVGCGWDKELVATHFAISEEKNSNAFCGSKYVQSNMKTTFEDIKMALNSEKKILFIGTPCQVAAINNVFKENINIYTIALICGGVASPKIWEMFKAEMEEKYHSKMIYADFRHKGRYGWNSPVALYKFENGKESKNLSFHTDKYVLQYLYGTFKRDSCHHCQYKGNNIVADLILGDFWGNVEFRKKSNNQGVSAIIVRSKKGLELLDLLKEECCIIDSTLDEILQKNQPLISSVSSRGNTDQFFNTVDELGYFKSIKKYGAHTNLIKYYAIIILDKLRLFEIFKRINK